MQCFGDCDDAQLNFHNDLLELSRVHEFLQMTDTLYLHIIIDSELSLLRSERIEDQSFVNFVQQIFHLCAKFNFCL